LFFSKRPYATLLGHIPATELYKDVKLYKDVRILLFPKLTSSKISQFICVLNIKAHELYKIKIVRIQQELHATNAAMFKKAIYELTDLKPQPYIEIKNKINKYKAKMEAKKNPKPSPLIKVLHDLHFEFNYYL
jgi:hypothetical protein